MSIASELLTTVTTRREELEHHDATVLYSWSSPELHDHLGLMSSERPPIYAGILRIHICADRWESDHHGRYTIRSYEGSIPLDLATARLRTVNEWKTLWGIRMG